MKKKIKNEHELSSFVRSFMEKLSTRGGATIVTLSGDLGAGKTTFVKSVADYFNIDEEITSPTFVIQKGYEIKKSDISFKKMIHIDAYRLEDKSELEYLGWNELIKNPEHIIFMEWPEQVEGISLPEAISVNIKILDDDSRLVQILN